VPLPGKYRLNLPATPGRSRHLWRRTASPELFKFFGRGCRVKKANLRDLMAAQHGIVSERDRRMA
jgi:hypothetical protein